jgi:hypothetical protein
MVGLGRPQFTPKDADHELALIEVEVRNTATGQVERTRPLSDFAVEALDGTTYRSQIQQGTLRSIPIGVRKGAVLSRFRTHGWLFDLEEIERLVAREIETAAAGEHGTAREPTDAEKIAGWKGERVRILGRRVGDRRAGGKLVGFHADGQPGVELPEDRYAGRAGTIVETTWTAPRGAARVVVALDDTGERIVTSSHVHLGFFAELEAAKRVRGTVLWAKGRRLLYGTSDGCKTTVGTFNLERGKGWTVVGGVTVKNLEPVTVTGAEFGDLSNRIYLALRTESGEDGCLTTGYDFATGADAFLAIDGRFSIRRGTASPTVPYTRLFHSENPRARQAGGGSTHLWGLVQSDMVRSDMDLDMARLACGTAAMTRIGFIVSNPGKQVAAMYECGKQRFWVVDGRVAAPN